MNNKRINIMILFILIVVIITGCNGSNRVKGFLAEEHNVDKFYSLAVSGGNVIIYEWTTQTSPKMKCMTMFTHAKSNTQCVRYTK